MSAFITTLLVGATDAIWVVLGKLVSKSFLEKLITKLIISGLENLVKQTETTIDDELVAEVKKALIVEGN